MIETSINSIDTCFYANQTAIYIIQKLSHFTLKLLGILLNCLDLLSDFSTKYLELRLDFSLKSLELYLITQR